MWRMRGDVDARISGLALMKAMSRRLIAAANWPRTAPAATPARPRINFSSHRPSSREIMNTTSSEKNATKPRDVALLD